MTTAACRVASAGTTRSGRKERAMKSSRLGLFIALGAAVGVALSASSHQIPVGLALGTAFGVAIGAVAERQRR